MKFENFANGISKSLVNPAEHKEVSRFSVFQGEMVKKPVFKSKFSQLND